ncbi:zinc finger protein 479-like [Octopus sinensis]|uniref:Zinc finger protein 479-like n=1 Tax=Octopus sinensis TaxID=2607531 RepID=A0A6P7SQ76_9MOLL|nr:zinc finger protein 479-like [Octopus sinensis]
MENELCENQVKCITQTKQIDFPDNMMLQEIRKSLYLCDICNKPFSQKGGNLTKHKYIHIGEKPYHCDICGKSFFQRVHVTSHKRTHTEKRKHNSVITSEQCSLYNYSYIYIGDNFNKIIQDFQNDLVISTLTLQQEP